MLVMGKGMHDMRHERVKQLWISHVDSEFTARHDGRQQTIRGGNATQDGAIRESYDVIRTP